MPRWDDGAPEPNIVGQFTPWIPWCDRSKVKESNYDLHAYGGVYILAHFERRVPSGPADYLDDRVIYVGEGNHLGRRWYQFERSARYKLSGHSGGHSHRRWRRTSGASWESLHLAVFPIWFKNEGDTDASGSLARRFRLYVEQVVLWQIIRHRATRDQPMHLLNVK